MTLLYSLYYIERAYLLSYEMFNIYDIKHFINMNTDIGAQQMARMD